MTISNNSFISGKVSGSVSFQNDKSLNTENTMDFKSVMDSASKVENTPNSTNDTKADSKKVVDKSERNGKDISKDNELKDSKIKDNKKTENTSDKKEESEVSMDDKDEKIDFSQLAVAIDSIKDKLAENLGITIEDLDAQMEKFQISEVDLLNSDKLQSFVLKINDATVTDVLTNEKLASVMAENLEDLSDVLSDFNLDEDKINEIVNSINDQFIKSNSEEHADITNMADKDPLLNQNMEIINGENSNKTVNNPSKNVDKDINDTSIDDSNNLVSEDTKTSVQVKVTSANNEFSKDNKDDREFKNQNQFSNEFMGEIKNNINNIIENNIDSGEKAQAEDIIRQIIDQIKVNVKNDSTSLELQLYPEHLGKVQIEVASKEGVITAKITAENEFARSAIESNINVLKENFNNQNLRVEAVEVSVATPDFQQNNSNKESSENQGKSNSSRRKINLNDLELNEEELTEDEQIAVELMQKNGSSVDFSA